AVTSAGRGGGVALAVGFWLSALSAGAHAQFFNITPLPRPPADVPEAAPPPAPPTQNVAPPNGARLAPTLPNGPMLQSLPPPGNAVAAPSQTPVTPSGHVTLALSARFGRDLPAITGGLHWSIYPAKVEQGALRPIKEDKGAAPTFALPPGTYVVHV